MKEIPSEIIQRAAELWGRKLYTPVFDNGDNSEVGFLGHALATMNMQYDKDTVDDLGVSVGVFKKSLVEELIRIRDTDDEYLDCYLGVDYHPCKYLADAATKASIPHSLFSCKSHIYLAEDHVTASFGYGAESMNHYPLPGGGWLITTLRGSEDDMLKIIDHVIAGNTMRFDVEHPGLQ